MKGWLRYSAILVARSALSISVYRSARVVVRSRSWSWSPGPKMFSSVMPVEYTQKIPVGLQARRRGMKILGEFEASDLALVVPGDLGFCTHRVAEREARISKAVDAVLRAGAASLRPGPAESLALLAVEWQWLYGFGRKNRLSLDPSLSAVAVQGPNASGKTALADIVSLGLFGRESDRRESRLRPASMICDRKPRDDAAWVETVVRVSGSDFRIRREFAARKDDKVARSATVVAEGSGAVVASGNAETDAWVRGFLTPEDFALVDVRDRDFLGMSPADQKAFMDAALKTAGTQAELEAVAESQKAHAWLGKGLAAAADAAAHCPDDPSDDKLANAMLDAKRSAREVCLLRSKIAFARLAARVCAGKRDLARRLRDFPGTVTPENACEDLISRLGKEVRDAERRLRTAESALRASEASMVVPPAEGPGDPIPYLEEKSAKYQAALVARSRLDGLGEPRPFNEGCWACAEREGEGVNARAECQATLAAAGVSGSSEEISKKARGYERRLAQARDRADREARAREWAEEHRAVAARVDAARELHEAARTELERRLLSRDLFLSGLGEGPGWDAREHDNIGLVDRLCDGMAAARKREAASRRLAGDLRAARKAANNQRVRSGLLMRTGTALLEKSAALKLAHASGNQRFEDAFCDAVDRLAAAANAFLRSAYPSLVVEAEWHHRASFVLHLTNGGGVKLPIEKASGFERSAVSLAIKAALRTTGLAASSGWMLVDEATAGFDSRNAALLPALLREVAAATGRVVALTHSPIDGLDKIFHITAAPDGSRRLCDPVPPCADA